MSNNSYFGIVEREAIAEDKNFPTFCGKNLKIFNAILNETLLIEEDKPSQQGIQGWSVTFFKDSHFAQTLTFKVIHEGAVNHKLVFEKLPENQNEWIAARVALIPNIKTEEDKALYCQNASWFVRKSGTLTTEDLRTLSSQWRHIDGRGLVLLEKYDGLEQPKRQILLLMLAIAYNQAFEQINQQLANALKPPSSLDEIETLYEQAALFNARYYFANPVKLSNYPTYKYWQDVRDAYELPTQYEELNEQIVQVHSILSHRQKQKDDIEKERWTKKVTHVGVVLSAIGLIEAGDTLIENFGLPAGGMMIGLIVCVLLWLLCSPVKSKKSNEVS